MIPKKVKKINNRICPIQNKYIEKYLIEKELNLSTSQDWASSYRKTDFGMIN